ncbi:MAG: diguanylate cyclase [Chloroflexota bacterium]
MSIGVASLHPDVHNLNELINRADQAMYKAKGMGGDKFVVY